MPDEESKLTSDEASEREDRSNVTDEAAENEPAGPVKYSITSFGSDPDVEGLVRRLNRDEIIIPEFQRGYIWNIKEASRFIESLLLGLPVPGIFLAREEGSNKQLVIDGQQRLKTLQFFFNDVFNPKPSDKTQRVFKLTDVQAAFEGLTYKTLPEKDRLQLESAVIHATIVKQDSPKDDDTSICHIFERLNSGGRRLAKQEIRVAACHGSFVGLLKRLNSDSVWRGIYGKESPRLKDEELILRFIALYRSAASYERPMNDFLNRFCRKHRNLADEDAEKWTKLFSTTISAVNAALSQSAFRPERALNAAVFDAVMVAVAKRLERAPITDNAQFKSAYDGLLASENFQRATSSATADKKNVEDRLKDAIRAFSEVR